MKVEEIEQNEAKRTKNKSKMMAEPNFSIAMLEYFNRTMPNHFWILFVNQFNSITLKKSVAFSKQRKK